MKAAGSSLLGFIAGAVIASIGAWFVLSRKVTWRVVRDPETGDIIRVEKSLKKSRA